MLHTESRLGWDAYFLPGDLNLKRLSLFQTICESSELGDYFWFLEFSNILKLLNIIH